MKAFNSWSGIKSRFAGGDSSVVPAIGCESRVGHAPGEGDRSSVYSFWSVPFSLPDPSIPTSEQPHQMGEK